MKAGIAGIGTFLPEHVRTNDAWPASFGVRASHAGDRTFNDIPKAEDEVAAALVERDLEREASDPFLGALRRHVADDALSASEAEIIAGRRALAEAGIAGGEVDLVLSNSMVPDRVALPPSAVDVAHALGCHRAQALGIEAACATAVSQLEIARAYVEAGLSRVVLLTQSHLMLRTFPLTHPACPGLGDAASAMVVTADGPLVLRGTYAVTHGEFGRAVVWLRGNEDSTDTPWWKAGTSYRLGSRAPEQTKALCATPSAMPPARCARPARAPGSTWSASTSWRASSRAASCRAQWPNDSDCRAPGRSPRTRTSHTSACVDRCSTSSRRASLA